MADDATTPEPSLSGKVALVTGALAVSAWQSAVSSRRAGHTASSSPATWRKRRSPPQACGIKASMRRPLSSTLRTKRTGGRPMPQSNRIAALYVFLNPKLS